MGYGRVHALIIAALCVGYDGFFRRPDYFPRSFGLVSIPLSLLWSGFILDVVGRLFLGRTIVLSPRTSIFVGVLGWILLSLIAVGEMSHVFSGLFDVSSQFYR